MKDSIKSITRHFLSKSFLYLAYVLFAYSCSFLIKQNQEIYPDEKFIGYREFSLEERFFVSIMICSVVCIVVSSEFNDV